MAINAILAFIIFITSPVLVLTGTSPPVNGPGYGGHGPSYPDSSNIDTYCKLPNLAQECTLAGHNYNYDLKSWDLAIYDTSCNKIGNMNGLGVKNAPFSFYSQLSETVVVTVLGKADLKFCVNGNCTQSDGGQCHASFEQCLKGGGWDKGGMDLEGCWGCRFGCGEYVGWNENTTGLPTRPQPPPVEID